MSELLTSKHKTEILTRLIDKLVRFIARLEETVLIDETIYSDNRFWLKEYLASFAFTDEQKDLILKLLDSIVDNA